MSFTMVKTLHVLSMVLLFGTGLGSAFYKWQADRSGQLAHMAATNRQVVLADWLFTTPTVVLQPATGLWMLDRMGGSWQLPWVAASLMLYAVAGACWLPVVVLQLRMRGLTDQAVARGLPLAPVYWRMARAWFWLGVPAFVSMVSIVALMVGKPGLGMAP